MQSHGKALVLGAARQRAESTALTLSASGATIRLPPYGRGVAGLGRQAAFVPRRECDFTGNGENKEASDGDADCEAPQTVPELSDARPAAADAKNATCGRVSWARASAIATTSALCTVCLIVGFALGLYAATPKHVSIHDTTF